jgi:hypothetical protein
VAAVEERSIFSAGHREPRRELTSQTLRLDDRVDDEFAREPYDIDVLLVLVVRLLDGDRPLPLAMILLW